MPHINMDEAETVLFNEVGERGDAFRRAMRDREAELVGSQGWMVEAVDSAGAMVDQSPANVDRALGLMFIAKHLERIADHSTNLAEMVVYLVRGKDVRHKFSLEQPK
jgi:phosphate uptake regulator